MTTQPLSALTMLLSRHTRRREFIMLLDGAAAASLSCLRLSALFDRVVTQKGMDAAYRIDHLGDAQVHDEAGKRQGLAWRVAVNLSHQFDHLNCCNRRRFVKAAAETKGEPATGLARPGQCQTQLGMESELHFHLHWAVQRRSRDLSVALHRVSVTGREEPAIDRDRQKQHRAFR